MLFVEGVGYVEQPPYTTAATTNVQPTADNSFGVVLDTESEKINQEKTYQLDAIFDEAAKKYNLPKNLLLAVAYCESGFNPEATSRSGAKGIMQLMPSTCASYGVQNPYDPYESIMGGAAVLKDISRMYDGNLTLTIASYNAGAGAVKKYGGVPPYEETQKYVAKVLNCMKTGVAAPDKTVTTTASTQTTENTATTQTDVAVTTSVSTAKKAEEAKKTAETIAQIQKIMQETQGYRAGSATSTGSNLLASMLENIQDLQVTPESLNELLSYTQYQFLMTHYASMLDIIATLGSTGILQSDNEENDSLTDLFRLGNYQISMNRAGLNLRQPQ